MKSKIIFLEIILLVLSIVFSGCKKEDTTQTVSTSGGTGNIASLDCGSATNNGTLTENIDAINVNSSLTYSGGNGGSYSGQTITSTGVTGLTATLKSGSFANGSGSLTYNITGTPSSAGTAGFVLDIGGQTCILNRQVNNGGNTGGITSCGSTNVHNPSLTYGSMTDQDGNTYTTIVIGTQEWMAENLKASHYRNGDLIPLVTNDSTWSILSTGATSWYNNDSATYNCPYGKLYNWYAVADSRNVCPSMWHVPSDSDWIKLTNYLGGETVAGGKMKSLGLQYWISPNTAADNSSGFSGVPGGYRRYNGSFSIGYLCNWWSSTEVFSNQSTYRQIRYTSGVVIRSSEYNSYGFSVRCIKD